MANLGDVMVKLPQVFTDFPGLTTVRDSYPKVAPKADELPLLFFDVGKPRSIKSSHRRTMVWPISMCLLATLRSEDISADLAIAYPWPERLVGQLDQNITLGGLLAAPMDYPDPMLEDEIGPLMLRKSQYVGFILVGLFPIFVARAFHV